MRSLRKYGMNLYRRTPLLPRLSSDYFYENMRELRQRNHANYGVFVSRIELPS